MKNFDFLKSKIRELHIPLPNFKQYFHEPSSEEKVFENFIGREDISEQLEEWLTNGDSGAYLITGYRGMGKSSFVGKVLNRITRKREKDIWVRCFRFCCLIFISSVTVLLFGLLNWNDFLKDYTYNCPNDFGKIETIRSATLISIIILIFLSFIFILGKVLFDKHWSVGDPGKRKLLKHGAVQANYKSHKIWFEKIFNIKNFKRKTKHNLIIKLNLGHETLKEKDILSLIAKRIHDTYKDYLNDFYTNWLRIIFKTILLFFGAIILVQFFDDIDITRFFPDSIIGVSVKSSDIYRVFYSFIENIVTSKAVYIIFSPKLIVKIISIFFFYFLLRKFFYFSVYQIPFLRKHSGTIIINQLKFLIERIESAITEDSGPNSGFMHSTSLFSFNFSRRKHKTYPNASTREIEDELIQIFKKIKIVAWVSCQPPPKFIIVFDELDKIDPVYNRMVKTEQDVPEFEASVSFQGGSISRNRKQNVLRLLGNMKLFMSQAKAKFVFISGRELYDAFLADLADREFAASSIFNGVIYVNSFLESSTKQKNILTKTEEFICGYLLPKKWYKEEAEKQWRESKAKKTYCDPNLGLYKKFLIEELVTNHLIRNKEIVNIKKIEQLNFSNFIEFKQIVEIEEIIIELDLLNEVKDIFLQIDKIVVFLNQFSIYLTHVCNGSPKKITTYFEQYIKSFIYKHPKNLFSRSNSKAIKKATYCLSFTAIDQQNIGFIHYMTYPIVQTVINKTSHFGDKMLVSVSFLIDHIFKHHKGGFSYENIEHTPELLEVYHIPNLRSMIDAILSFLRQNHVTDICGGVYQYKFRKSIADEIMYNSRISEEISAIFNFTLDESLPVKRYYYKQIEDNEKKYLELEKRIRTEPVKEQYAVRNQYATTLVSQLEILAEIHMFDEEYNEAIQYFQTAFDIIKTELGKCKEDKDKLHLYLLLNRTALKLGLAKECKGYYNEAFVIYNTLLDYLVKFRNVEEAELGLNYFLEDNVLKSGEWKAKKMKIFHNTDGRLITEDDFYKNEVLPYYRQSEKIQDRRIDFLIESDYVVSGLSRVLSPLKQEKISRLTLFSEVKSVYQSILTNLFIVEKIDVNGITQENLDLAEDQFKYIFLHTDSKDKFIQAADFYKKLASILFLKNFSNPKMDEYLQMWGFDFYETINEFCFINSDKYGEMIAGKFPKEILKEFFIDKLSSRFLGKEKFLFDYFTQKEDKNKMAVKIKGYIKDLKKAIGEDKRKVTHYTIEKDVKRITTIINEFIDFSEKKRKKYFVTEDLKKCRTCYIYCSDRKKNHPCYACNYVSTSLYIFINVLTPKYEELIWKSIKKKKEEKIYSKGKSYFFKFLEYIKQDKTNNSYFFVLASALRIKADIGLSCLNKEKGNDKLSNEFLSKFFDFLTNYYDYKKDIIDNFIKDIIETDKISKLEKTILFYWLSAEYFYLHNSPVDANECLTKILIVFEKYLTINKELELLGGKRVTNPFLTDTKELFKKIQETIVRRVLRNSNITNDDVNYIELQNLKYILRNKPIMNINLSSLSTTANIEEVLFSYCKLELNTIDFNNYNNKDNLIIDCYKSTLLSPNDFPSTIQEKILSMEYKEKMNMAIFRSLFIEYGKHSELNFYDYDFQIKYYTFLDNYLKNEGTENSNFYKKFLELLELKYYETAPSTKPEFLLFLISDSLYCLTQIIEILSSDRFSNFSNGFIGDIYYQISKWATLYRLTYAILRKDDANSANSELKIFKDKEATTMWERKINLEKNDDKQRDNLLTEISDLINAVFDILKNNENIITNSDFETNLLNDIGAGNRQFLVPNYSVAMALKYYHKMIEINSEGKEYKEMVRKMYIIDDDISNGMHNFSLALERYAMNCEVIEKKMTMLRKYFKEALSYPLRNYLKDSSKTPENQQ